MKTTETPFMLFWRAMNDHLKANGYPELTFGPAKELFADTTIKAKRAAITRARLIVNH